MSRTCLGGGVDVSSLGAARVGRGRRRPRGGRARASAAVCAGGTVARAEPVGVAREARLCRRDVPRSHRDQSGITARPTMPDYWISGRLRRRRSPRVGGKSMVRPSPPRRPRSRSAPRQPRRLGRGCGRPSCPRRRSSARRRSCRPRCRGTALAEAPTKHGRRSCGRTRRRQATFGPSRRLAARAVGSAAAEVSATAAAAAVAAAAEAEAAAVVFRG